MDKVRIALVGTGGIARKHTNAAKTRTDIEIVGLMDVNDEGVHKFAEREYPEAADRPPVFTDAATMYAEVQPDAVVISTPHTLHYEQCLQALAAGCHVLVEKPMVTSLKHAVALEKRVKKLGRILCVAYNTPCSARFYTLREYARRQTYGKLKVIGLDISQCWYQGTIGSWRQKPELSGGGMAYDSGAHVLNSLVWTVEADVAEVHAWIDNLDSPVDINGSINVRFVNDVTACIAIGGEMPAGARGTFLFEKARVEIDPWGAGNMSVRTKDGEVQPEMLGADSGPLGNFVDAILGNDEPRTSPRNGVLQSQLMDAVYKSARTGRPAKPPVVK